MPGAGPNPPRYIPTLTEVVDTPPSVEPVAWSDPPVPALDAGWAASDSAPPGETDVGQALSRLTDRLAHQLEQQLQAWCRLHARSWAEACVRDMEPVLRDAWLQSAVHRQVPDSGSVEGGQPVTD